jgi:serine/threonine-protein kinase HipA
MNRCTFCGETIEGSELLHKNCTKKMFGVNFVPEIDFTLKEISLKAQEMAGKLSISGIQPKLSIKLNKTKKIFEVTSENGEYILKPQSNLFSHLPENENLCMTMAKKVGINVADNCLVKLKDDSFAYLAKRFDREKGEKKHQEDFFQILNKEDKYKSSLEEIGKKLKEISIIPGLDVQLFFDRILFFFLIGNGDAHLKNFSVKYDNLDDVRLSPAYDIVSSKLVIPNEEDFALSMTGKRNRIKREDFLIFAKYLDIPQKVVEIKFLDKKNFLKEMILDSYLEKDAKNSLLEIIDNRFLRWEK